MHPLFQIGGNFGATAGIVEMLVQSYSGVIDLLPALPQSWESVTLLGLKQEVILKLLLFGRIDVMKNLRQFYILI